LGMELQKKLKEKRKEKITARKKRKGIMTPLCEGPVRDRKKRGVYERRKTWWRRGKKTRKRTENYGKKDKASQKNKKNNVGERREKNRKTGEKSPATY